MSDGAVLDSIVNEFRVAAGQINDLKALGFSKDEIHRLVIPRRTMERRVAGDSRLSLEESDRLMRLKTIAQHAQRVFANDDKAHRWLRKPNRGLGGARPIDLLISETGARQVENTLGAIQHGIFT